MIGKKQIRFSFAIFFNLLVLVLAVKNDCEEYEDNVENLAYKFLSNIKPLRYQVYIDPCISDGNFSGYVHIDLILFKPTKNFSLHSQDLQFCEEGVYLTLKGSLNDTHESLKPVTNTEYGESSLQDLDEFSDDSSETIKPTGFTYHKKEHTVTMIFNELLKPARYSLEINYMGAINSDSVGLYRKSYKDVDGENRVMLLTNFFPTSARRVFPCRDEPEIKAEVYFTMQTSLNYTTVVANAPDNFIEYKEGQRWTRFHSIVNSSTYQLNFAVLNSINNTTRIHENKTYITHAVVSDLKLVKLAQDTYEKAMGIMEKYTKIKYPLDTFISLVIPEKTEITSSSSLGFITTKKSNTIYTEKLGPQKKKDVILQASQDIASQWFNQIVSPVSWKYFWLNDGITVYMKYYIADKIIPDWKLKDIFVIWELQRRSFIPNKLTDSPPLIRNVSNKAENIQCLFTRSISSASMSASLLRMVSHFLTENIFQSGIKIFLKANKFNSVNPEDFWEAIQIAINDAKDQRLEKMNITEIMKTWTSAEFYPIVNVSRNYTSGSMRLTQIPAVKLFNLTEKNVTDKWWIPINFATQKAPNFNVTLPSHWLKPDIKELIIDGVDHKSWVIFNIQQTGYYRVLYDEENWKRLASYLNSENYHKISVINRAQIINDAIQFALKRQLDMNIFLDLLSYLQRETNYIPWYDAQFIFSFLNYHLANTHAFDSLKNFSLRLIIPLVDKIGYEDRPNDDFSTLLLRRISNHWACYFGYEKCWNNATKQLEAYLDNKKTELGSVDLQEWARCVGLNGANEKTWNKMFSKYKEDFSEDTLIHLACSENSTILNQFLNMAIRNDSEIPEKHVLSVFKSVCLYPSGSDKRINLCLKFINQQFEKIKFRFGNSSEHFVHLLDLLASEIRQKSQLEEFQKLVSQERASFASSKLFARIMQTKQRVIIFEQKAKYYEPFFKAKTSHIQKQQCIAACG